MKRFLVVSLVLFSSHLMQAQNQWGLELTGGAGHDYTYNNKNITDISIVGFGMFVSYQLENSPWSFHAGAEGLLSNNFADIVRIPLKANYSFGKNSRFFLGSGFHYNYVISTFTNVSESNFGLNVESGYKIPLSRRFELIPRISYSYDFKRIQLNDKSYYHNYLMLNISFRVKL